MLLVANLLMKVEETKVLMGQLMGQQVFVLLRIARRQRNEYFWN